ncbi:SDR family oxidoreductase [Actinoplanes oblitus]|uniref:SDR family oxidoreductase n=1 Tax=Actinoplanes oblitus TaxID=3040509 RepID=A0ABY8W4X5_9ACTN|nr:SDR family oxidoreductase [Actinoplanes oblitus]WIM92557.1 SDR family oxidoreductase [Actinoplanes oblitus]
MTTRPCLTPARSATLDGMNNYDLHSRTAVVTGAASGMGAATAALLAAGGARVALLARRRNRVEELAAKIEAAGGTALAVTADVTDQAAVTAAADRIGATLGPVDLVVNAAGVMLPNPIGEARREEWARMIDTNLTGALDVISAFLPGLRAAAAAGRPADLVNISSIGAHVLFPNYAVYSATKAALTQLSAGLRAELGPESVRVTNIEPGLTDTELGGHIDNGALSGQLDAMFQALPALSADDVADLIGYVTSRPRHVNLRQVIVLPTPQ